MNDLQKLCLSKFDNWGNHNYTEYCLTLYYPDYNRDVFRIFPNSKYSNEDSHIVFFFPNGDQGIWINNDEFDECFVKAKREFKKLIKLGNFT